MVKIKDAKRGWLDGKQHDMWPDIGEHVGWTVVTAGPVDLELEGHTAAVNNGRLKQLPSGYPMILKNIDKTGMAYAYHHDNGGNEDASGVTEALAEVNGLYSYTCAGIPVGRSWYNGLRGNYPLSRQGFDPAVPSR
jgi:hypothetical protein